MNFADDKLDILARLLTGKQGNIDLESLQDIGQWHTMFSDLDRNGADTFQNLMAALLGSNDPQVEDCGQGEEDETWYPIPRTDGSPSGFYLVLINKNNILTFGIGFRHQVQTGSVNCTISGRIPVYQQGGDTDGCLFFQENTSHHALLTVSAMGAETFSLPELQIQMQGIRLVIDLPLANSASPDVDLILEQLKLPGESFPESRTLDELADANPDLTHFVIQLILERLKAQADIPWLNAFKLVTGLDVSHTNWPAPQWDALTTLGFNIYAHWFSALMTDNCLDNWFHALGYFLNDIALKASGDPVNDDPIPLEGDGSRQNPWRFALPVSLSQGADCYMTLGAEPDGPGCLYPGIMFTVTRPLADPSDPSLTFTTKFEILRWPLGRPPAPLSVPGITVSGLIHNEQPSNPIIEQNMSDVDGNSLGMCRVGYLLCAFHIDEARDLSTRIELHEVAIGDRDWPLINMNNADQVLGSAIELVFKALFPLLGFLDEDGFPPSGRRLASLAGLMRPLSLEEQHPDWDWPIDLLTTPDNLPRLFNDPIGAIACYHSQVLCHKEDPAENPPAAHWMMEELWALIRNNNQAQLSGTGSMADPWRMPLIAPHAADPSAADALEVTSRVDLIWETEIIDDRPQVTAALDVSSTRPLIEAEDEENNIDLTLSQCWKAMHLDLPKASPCQGSAHAAFFPGCEVALTLRGYPLRLPTLAGLSLKADAVRIEFEWRQPNDLIYDLVIVNPQMHRGGSKFHMPCLSLPDLSWRGGLCETWNATPDADKIVTTIFGYWLVNRGPFGFSLAGLFGLLPEDFRFPGHPGTNADWRENPWQIPWTPLDIGNWCDFFQNPWPSIKMHIKLIFSTPEWVWPALHWLGGAFAFPSFDLSMPEFAWPWDSDGDSPFPWNWGNWSLDAESPWFFPWPWTGGDSTNWHFPWPFGSWGSWNSEPWDFNWPWKNLEDSDPWRMPWPWWDGDMDLPDLSFGWPWWNPSEDEEHQWKFPKLGELPFQVKGNGTYEDPWAIWFKDGTGGFKKWRPIFWIDPDGPVTPNFSDLCKRMAPELVELGEDQLKELLGQYDLSINQAIALLAQAAGHLPELAALLTGYLTQGLEDELKLLEAHLNAGDGLIKLEGNLEEGLIQAQLSSGDSEINEAWHFKAPHHRQLSTTNIQDKISEKITPIENQSTVLIGIGGPWTEKEAWQGLIEQTLAGAKRDDIPHIDFREYGVPPDQIGVPDLDLIPGAANWITANLAAFDTSPEGMNNPIPVNGSGSGSQSAQVRRIINRVQTELAGAEIILIAHSQAGLAAKAAIDEIGDASQAIKKFIAVGTDFAQEANINPEGIADSCRSAVAFMQKLAKIWGKQAFDGANTIADQGVKQMMAGVDFLFDMISGSHSFAYGVDMPEFRLPDLRQTAFKYVNDLDLPGHIQTLEIRSSLGDTPLSRLITSFLWELMRDLVEDNLDTPHLYSHVGYGIAWRPEAIDIESENIQIAPEIRLDIDRIPTGDGDEDDEEVYGWERWDDIDGELQPLPRLRIQNSIRRLNGWLVGGPAMALRLRWAQIALDLSPAGCVPDLVLHDGAVDGEAMLRATLKELEGGGWRPESGLTRLFDQLIQALDRPPLPCIIETLTYLGLVKQHPDLEIQIPDADGWNQLIQDPDRYMGQQLKRIWRSPSARLAFWCHLEQCYKLDDIPFVSQLLSIIPAPEESCVAKPLLEAAGLMILEADAHFPHIRNWFKLIRNPKDYIRYAWEQLTRNSDPAQLLRNQTANRIFSCLGSPSIPANGIQVFGPWSITHRSGSMIQICLTEPLVLVYGQVALGACIGLDIVNRELTLEVTCDLRADSQAVANITLPAGALSGDIDVDVRCRVIGGATWYRADDGRTMVNPSLTVFMPEIDIQYDILKDSNNPDGEQLFRQILTHLLTDLLLKHIIQALSGRENLPEPFLRLMECLGQLHPTPHDMENGGTDNTSADISRRIKDLISGKRILPMTVARWRHRFTPDRIQCMLDHLGDLFRLRPTAPDNGQNLHQWQLPMQLYFTYDLKENNTALDLGLNTHSEVSTAHGGFNLRLGLLCPAGSAKVPEPSGEIQFIANLGDNDQDARLILTTGYDQMSGWHVSVKKEPDGNTLNLFPFDGCWPSMDDVTEYLMDQILAILRENTHDTDRPCLHELFAALTDLDDLRQNPESWLINRFNDQMFKDALSCMASKLGITCYSGGWCEWNHDNNLIIALGKGVSHSQTSPQSDPSSLLGIKVTLQPQISGPVEFGLDFSMWIASDNSRKWHLSSDVALQERACTIDGYPLVPSFSMSTDQRSTAPKVTLSLTHKPDNADDVTLLSYCLALNPDDAQVEVNLGDFFITLMSGWILNENQIRTFLDKTLNGTVSCATVLKSLNVISETDQRYTYNSQGTPCSLLDVLSSILNDLASSNTPIISLGEEPEAGIWVRDDNNYKGLSLFIQSINIALDPDISIIMDDSPGWMGDVGINDPGPLGISFLVNSSSRNFKFIANAIGFDIAGARNTAIFEEQGFSAKAVSLRGFVSLDGPDIQTGGAVFLREFTLPLGKAGTGNTIARNLLGGAASSINPSLDIGIAKKNDDFPTLYLSGDLLKANELWIPIQKGFGPVYVKQFGIRFIEDNGDKALNFLMDAQVSLSGLTIGLDDLTVSMEGIAGLLKPDTWSLDLEGMGVSYTEGDTRICGALRRIGQGSDIQYDGLCQVQMAGKGMTAFGSYRELNTSPSMFVFILIDATIGGPPFFFVTGLAGGFGYNRDLIAPDIGDVSTYPMIEAAQAPGQYDLMNPVDFLDEMNTYIPPRQGFYWLAAGVKFTTFELFDSFAMLYVLLNKGLEIGLLGRSVMQMPQEEPLVNLEMNLKVLFSTVQGVVAARAQLDDTSWLFSKHCRLTGGFAFYSWFDNEHKGDFVISLGGYHDRYQRPDHYPDVPRLGFDWQVSKKIVIKGEAYFALTSNAAMAGGLLDASYHDGNLKAWFRTWAHFLIQWKPFYYDIDIGVSIGASYKIKIDLWIGFITKTLKVELGGRLHIWGPEFGGTATLDWWVISVTIPFGADRRSDDHSRLSWHEFKSSFLPASNAYWLASPGKGLLDELELEDSGTDVKKKIWIVQGSFSLKTETIIPANRVDVGVSGIFNPAIDRTHEPIDVRPCQYSSLESTHKIKILHSRRGCILTGNDEYSGLMAPLNDASADGISRLYGKDAEMCRMKVTALRQQIVPALWRWEPHASDAHEHLEASGITGCILEFYIDNEILLNLAKGPVRATGYDTGKFALPLTKTTPTAVQHAASVSDWFGSLETPTSGMGQGLAQLYSKQWQTSRKTAVQICRALGANLPDPERIFTNGITHLGERSALPSLKTLFCGLNADTQLSAAAKEQDPAVFTDAKPDWHIVLEGVVQQSLPSPKGASSAPVTTLDNFQDADKLLTIKVDDLISPSVPGATLKRTDEGTAPNTQHTARVATPDKSIRNSRFSSRTWRARLKNQTDLALGLAAPAPPLSTKARRFERPGKGAIIKSGMTQVWRWQYCAGKDCHIRIQGNQGIRVTALNRGGRLIMDLEGSGDFQVDVPETTQVLAISGMGCLPLKSDSIPPEPARLTRITTQAGSDLIGWETNHRLPCITQTCMLGRGVVVNTGKAPRRYLAQIFRKIPTLVKAGGALAGQTSCRTSLPAHIDLIAIVLSRPGTGENIAPDDDVSIRIHGAIVDDIIRQKNLNQRIMLIYSVSKPDTTAGFIDVEVSTRGPWQLGGVVAGKGDVNDWLNDRTPRPNRNIVSPAPFTAWGVSTVQIKQPGLADRLTAYRDYMNKAYKRPGKGE